MSSFLITDPDCGFCQRSGTWLEKRFGRGWSNMPSNPTLLAEVGVSSHAAAESVWLVTIAEDGTVARHHGSDAVAHAIAARGGGWRVVLLATIPPVRWFAQAAYKLVAKNRHRLPGASPQCRTLPS